MNNKPSIAIADDHSAFRSEVVSVLEGSGYTVLLQTANGSELLRQMSSLTGLPDICILDMNMPMMNGLATTRALKRLWPQIKVVIYSLNNDNGQIMELLQCGADCYVDKRDDFSELVRQLG